MRDDLLDAQAAIDWAESHFPALEIAQNAWLKANIRVELRQTDPNSTHDVLVAIEKEPLSRAFNVEVGAYINVIRSALDILAVAVAKRHGIVRLDKVYFPIVDSAATFAAGKYKGSEFIKGIPTSEREVIEELKPYKGGDFYLWTLHQLDIVRKHHQLLTVGHAPVSLRITGVLSESDFVTLNNETGYFVSNNETILGLLKKGIPKPKIQYTPKIVISDSDIPVKAPVVPLLRTFAGSVADVIARFDMP
jgi:hypothetical protein